MIQKTALFLLLVICFSCKNESKKEVSEVSIAKSNHQQITKMHWLLGDWVNKKEEKFSKESWFLENDSTFRAFSYTQVGKDTVFAEHLTLAERDGKLTLTAVAFNQNDEQPVTFSLIPSEENRFTFENKAHDFPNRIIYTNPTKDSLHAWIEGIIEDEPRTVDFYFSRTK